MISTAFEDLSQALRVLLEANHRAHVDGLLFVDRAEAVGNIESGLNAVVNAFHSLYDAMEKDARTPSVNWYKDAALATILAIRNARHHNRANKIRQLYNFHVQTADQPQDMKSYVVVDFPASEEDADTFEVFLSWSDLEVYLSMPPAESRLKAETAELIKEYLAAPEFETDARRHDMDSAYVFFNVVPLIVNAAASIVPHIKDSISPKSTEAKTFSHLFKDMAPADTKSHISH